ncbi:E3 ubiquitin-protein ligase KCMF1 [Grus japonensis]|uniref:E3 ubiquitin-protein ligase KCMF1 n=1 Tax=Grus japonensis TaxID=30415 RepID=A0ABC9Y649_GRUJA
MEKMEVCDWQRNSREAVGTPRNVSEMRNYRENTSNDWMTYIQDEADLRGVSCDACLKGNFRGRRYKCLICYDYDLCATCYESGATTTRHTTDHPMQCILTRVDFDLYYGGEAFSVEQPQSFTCPYCGKMGYTETSLQEHVTSEHAETSTEVGNVFLAPDIPPGLWDLVFLKAGLASKD